jgi:nucleoside-diphosphate-sugar epimerase
VPAKLNVITGATGLLGSHLAEQLVARGERVRALVRSASDAAFLRQLGVELVSGDLQNPATIRSAVKGADVVYHAAARVGDYGSWKQFQEQVIDATRNVVTECRAAGVGRLLHVSSVAVYGHPRPRAEPFTEEEPFGQRLRLWDYYCRAKREAEELAWQFGSGVTVVRPSWIYGPRDRNSFPRLLNALRGRWVKILGSGANLLNIVYAGDVAVGAILAANHDGARGQAYHLCSDGEVTQRQFLDALTDALGMPRVMRRVPFAVAFVGGFCGEVIARVFHWKRAPYITRYSVSLVARPARYSSAKAQSQLGWQRRVGPLEGLRRTLEWYLAGGTMPVSHSLATGKTNTPA